MRLLLQLWRDERGTSLIELAIAAPILAVLTAGMIDLSEGFSQKLRLEQAAQRAIEKVMNGRADTTTINALKTEAANTAGVPESNVTTDFWLECNNTRAANYNSSCASGQTQARYLSVRITKGYTPFFLRYKFTSATANSYTLSGASTVRTQ